MAKAALTTLARIRSALDDLGTRPALLFTLLYALNAILFPYHGFFHDARLYGLQVLNRMSSGAFETDLFLRFGSQDRYTPFSLIAAPVARQMGIDWFFFCAFLGSTALLLWATERLVLALIDDRAAAVLSLLATTVWTLSYGGLGIFQVYESFFTPRLAASGLAVLGIERVLRGRKVTALFLAATATVVHPLMGCGALAVVSVHCFLDGIPRRALSLVLTTLAGVVALVLGVPRIGTAVFGTMDAGWLDVVRRASPYNFPLQWTVNDWFIAALSIAVAAAAGASFVKASRVRATVLLTMATVAAFGLLATIIAGAVPYRFLLQGQPYRALWLLRLLQIPLTVHLVSRLWPTERMRPWAALLAATMGLTNVTGSQPWIIVMMVVAFVLVHQGPWVRKTRPDWLVRSIVAGSLVGHLLWGAIGVLATVRRTSGLLAVIDPLDYLGILVRAPGPVFWWALVLIGVTKTASRLLADRVLPVCALAAGLAVHVVWFGLPRVSAYRDRIAPAGPDWLFARTYIAEHLQRRAPLTVYEGVREDIDFVWFSLGAKSYFNLTQLSGVLFARDTALEGQRRAELVRPFELERYAVVKEFLPVGDKLMIERVFDTDRASRPPTIADLFRLCRKDEAIDVVVLKHEFEGLASATDGRIYIYDCARVRTSAG